LHDALAAFAVIFAGQVNKGAMLSTMFRLKLHEVELLQESVAVMVIICVDVPVISVPGAGTCVSTIEAVGVQLSAATAKER
jgi:hypothetical protein